MALLVEEVSRRKDILLASFNAVITNKMKEWEQITQKINSVSQVEREV